MSENVTIKHIGSKLRWLGEMLNDGTLRPDGVHLSELSRLMIECGKVVEQWEPDIDQIADSIISRNGVDELITSIKELRQETGLGLKEAKAMIEQAAKRAR